MTPAHVMPIWFGGLIVWSVYRRVRRNIGRQRLRPRRAAISLVILSIVSVVTGGTSVHNINLLLGFGGGLVPGALLGHIGLSLTRFEIKSEGHFYTPSAHVGVALSLIFIGRLIYRYVMLRGLSPATNHVPAAAQSPLTLFIFGLLAGYYIVFYAGVLIHSHDQKHTVPPPRE